MGFTSRGTQRRGHPGLRRHSHQREWPPEVGLVHWHEGHLTDLRFSSWKWPKIPGLESFKGPRLHSANWDSKVDFNANTTVAVIGNGVRHIGLSACIHRLIRRPY